VSDLRRWWWVLGLIFGPLLLLVGVIAVSSGTHSNPQDDLRRQMRCVKAHDEYHGGVVYVVCDQRQPG
jgi:hypothetical protein